MKSDVIKCLCEILKAYSLENDWTPELEAKIIKRANEWSERQLKTILQKHTPANLLLKFDIDTSDQHFSNMCNNWLTDRNIYFKIKKNYQL